MREIDELYADSGEPVQSGGVSRRTALKIGGLGLAGVAASFLPGRAGAAVRKKATSEQCVAGFNCSNGYGGAKCGVDECSITGNCTCYTVAYRLHKAGQPNGACGADIFCDLIGSCQYEGDCPTGSFCAKNSCCGTPVCIPYCGLACDFDDAPTAGPASGKMTRTRS